VTTSLTKDPRQSITALRAEVAKVIAGQDAAVTGLLIGLLCRGHILIEGVPGVAKTLLVRTVATALELKFVDLRRPQQRIHLP
jgi:MoxR-like ATPase